MVHDPRYADLYDSSTLVNTRLKFFEDHRPRAAAHLVSDTPHERQLDPIARWKRDGQGAPYLAESGHHG
jgi:hypothetical protein